MTLKYVCNGCGLESEDFEIIPEYIMFVCDSYDGDKVNLCLNCERNIKDILEAGAGE